MRKVVDIVAPVAAGIAVFALGVFMGRPAAKPGRLSLFERAYATVARQPTAMDVCKRLWREGVAETCRQGDGGGLVAGAKEHVVFDLAPNPEKTGQVAWFDSPDALQAAAESFEAMAQIAGPHRYASAPSAGIFVQMNRSATKEDARTVKQILDSL